MMGLIKADRVVIRFIQIATHGWFYLKILDVKKIIEINHESLWQQNIIYR